MAALRLATKIPTVRTDDLQYAIRVHDIYRFAWLYQQIEHNYERIEKNTFNNGMPYFEFVTDRPRNLDNNPLTEQQKLNLAVNSNATINSKPLSYDMLMNWIAIDKLWPFGFVSIKGKRALTIRTAARPLTWFTLGIEPRHLQRLMVGVREILEHCRVCRQSNDPSHMAVIEYRYFGNKEQPYVAYYRRDGSHCMTTYDL